MSWSLSTAPMELYHLARLNHLMQMPAMTLSAMNPTLNPPVNQGLICTLPPQPHSCDLTTAPPVGVSEDDRCDAQNTCQGEQTGICSKQTDDLAATSSFEQTLQQALLFMIEALPKTPDRILFVGGCRMPAVARFLALQLPQSRITLADADPVWVERAKGVIGCRCAFIAIDPLVLPFESDRFDLTLVFNSLSSHSNGTSGLQPDDLPRFMSQLARVTHGQLIWGELQTGFLFKSLGQRLPSMPDALERWGIQDPPAVRSPKLDSLMTLLFRYGRVKQRFMPYPWRVFRADLHSVREDRLVLV
ncbi:MAG: hypothetical protein VKK59_07395 [Vampirovibrionales bacterium]|nr:hypothetical protein [Vampirovibrionales bacterium]